MRLQAPSAIRLGETLALSFEIVSRARVPQKLVVDYAIHYVKRSGGTSAKVFKLKEVALEAGAKLAIVKRQRVQDFTTRKHHPGSHRVELLMNGEVFAEGAFALWK